MEAMTNRVQRPMSPERMSTPQPPVIQEEYSRYFVEPQYQAPQPPSSTHMIDRNLVILIFIVFVIGLLLGKSMNPVVLTR